MKRGRPKKQEKYAQTAFKLPPELLAAIDSYIKSTTMNRSLFVRQAVIEYFERRNINIAFDVIKNAPPAKAPSKKTCAPQTTATPH